LAEGTLFVTPGRIRTRVELMPTGRTSVAQRMMASRTTAMTFCPWGERPAKGGSKIKRIKRIKADAILKIWLTNFFP